MCGGGCDVDGSCGGGDVDGSDGSSGVGDSGWSIVYRYDGGGLYRSGWYFDVGWGFCGGGGVRSGTGGGVCCEASPAVCKCEEIIFVTFQPDVVWNKWNEWGCVSLWDSELSGLFCPSGTW